ncbi:uncharacterized protein BDV17DRAFT_260329, partial [Aspergillus undulatus]|uniref:uncharacterized protein n=1 Tax=Aspergillus undulatus TaxID=1810928 RepID=UPI003CCE212A
MRIAAAHRARHVATNRSRLCSIWEDQGVYGIINHKRRRIPQSLAIDTSTPHDVGRM